MAERQRVANGEWRVVNGGTTVNGENDSEWWNDSVWRIAIGNW